MSAALYLSERPGEEDTVLVLLHGFCGTHRVWDGVSAALAGACRILAYDLPGHGASLAVSADGGANAAAGAILADLRARNIERFHLAGHSFGGATAALMALAEPDRVASITLFAPGGIGPEINAPLLREYAAARSADEIARTLAAMMAEPSPLPKEAIDDGLALRAVPGQLEAFAGLCEVITRNGRQGTIPRRALRALAMPARVVWGGLDGVVPVRQMQELPPNFVPHLFPDLGHLLPMEAPEEMAQILRCSIA